MHHRDHWHSRLSQLRLLLLLIAVALLLLQSSPRVRAQDELSNSSTATATGGSSDDNSTGGAAEPPVADTSSSSTSSSSSGSGAGGDGGRSESSTGSRGESDSTSSGSSGAGHLSSSSSTGSSSSSSSESSSSSSSTAAVQSTSSADPSSSSSSSGADDNLPPPLVPEIDTPAALVLLFRRIEPPLTNQTALNAFSRAALLSVRFQTATDGNEDSTDDDQAHRVQLALRDPYLLPRGSDPVRSVNLTFLIRAAEPEYSAFVPFAADLADLLFARTLDEESWLRRQQPFLAGARLVDAPTAVQPEPEEPGVDDPPALPSMNAKGSSTSRRNIALGVSLGVGGLLLLLVACVWCSRSRRVHLALHRVRSLSSQGSSSLLAPWESAAIVRSQAALRRAAGGDERMSESDSELHLSRLRLGHPAEGSELSAASAASPAAVASAARLGALEPSASARKPLNSLSLASDADVELGGVASEGGGIELASARSRSHKEEAGRGQEERKGDHPPSPSPPPLSLSLHVIGQAEHGIALGEEEEEEEVELNAGMI